MSKPKHHILIIDDSPEDRDTYRRYLCEDKDCEYTFSEIDMGEDGLHIVETEHFDCIILDYQLPDLDGVTFLQRLNQKTGLDHAPIVMVTGRGDERIAVQSLKLGVYDYFVKADLSPEAIYRATRNAIEKHEQKLKLAAETERARVIQEHLSLLVDGTQDHAMILMDKTGKITQWNKGAETLTGYVASEAVGKHIEILFDEKDRAKGVPHEELERARRAKRFEVERWLVNKDGRRFWATGSVSLLFAANGSIRGFAKIIRDGTQKRYFEEERSNERKWFESLLDFLPIPFILIEPRTGRTLFANRAAHEATGGKFSFAQSYDDYVTLFQLEDQHGRPITPKSYPSIQSLLGERLSSTEIIMHTPKGRRTNLVDAGIIAPLYGREAVIAATFQDITDVKQVQIDLMKAKAQAEDASTAKSHFLANMSHEIRTPLGAILGFTEVLVDEETSPADRKRFASIVKRNGQALTQIIDDILDLSKIEAGRLEIEFEKVNLNTIVGDVLELFSIRAADRGVELRSVIHGKIPEYITSDPTRLRQILFNVIGNAIKFTEEGHVCLEISSVQRMNGELKNFLQFRVSDTGVGIAPEHQKRLFQPFMQADNSTTRRFGGTGLGLMLSKRLAEALGGELTLLESKRGQGSTFEICIPLHADEWSETQSIEEIDDKSVSTDALKGAKILIIEDSEDSRNLFSRMLRRYGAVITLARDGKEGVEIASQGDFELIITDIQMPRMDGYEATRYLRSQGFKRPILGLTAHAFPEDREKSKANGLDDHLTKPVEADHLARRVSLHLTRSKGSIERSYSGHN